MGLFFFGKVFVRNMKKLTLNQGEQFLGAVCLHFMVMTVSKSVLGAS